MVKLQVKRNDVLLFFFETSLDRLSGEVLADIVDLHNSILKIRRIISHIEDLKDHGVALSPEIRGLTPDQISELGLKDSSVASYPALSLGQENPDPVQKRSGFPPGPHHGDLLSTTINNVKFRLSDVSVSFKKSVFYELIDILKGAISVVYPEGLPNYDPIREEFENREDLSEIKTDVLDPATSNLWFASKELKPEKLLKDYMGSNEKSKVTVKLGVRGRGPPVKERAITEEEEKRILIQRQKRLEELKKLALDDDDSYLNSPWADSSALRNKFHGLSNIGWKP